MSSSQCESVPVGSEEVTEVVDFWLVNTGGASAAAFSSSSSSPGDSLEESRVIKDNSLKVSTFFNKVKILAICDSSEKNQTVCIPVEECLYLWWVVDSWAGERRRQITSKQMSLHKVCQIWWQTHTQNNQDIKTHLLYHFIGKGHQVLLIIQKNVKLS